MRMSRALSHSTQARWALSKPLMDRWRRRALCRNRFDLPWTPNVIPSDEQLSTMSKICHQCPVIANCAKYALTPLIDGGFYAGVWIPWRSADKHERATPRQRARVLLQRKLLIPEHPQEPL